MKKDPKKLSQPDAVNSQNDNKAKGTFDIYRCIFVTAFVVSSISAAYICCKITYEMFTWKIPVDNRKEVDKGPYFFVMRWIYVTILSCLGVLAALPHPYEIFETSAKPSDLKGIFKWFRNMKVLIQLMNASVFVSAAMQDCSTDIFALLFSFSGVLVIVLLSVIQVELVFKTLYIETDKPSVSLNVSPEKKKIRSSWTTIYETSFV